jgi:hypothetical protein
VHDKLKRGSWDGYKIDKIWKEIIELRLIVFEMHLKIIFNASDFECEFLGCYAIGGRCSGIGA